MARQWLSRSSSQPLTLREAMNRLFDDALIGAARGEGGGLSGLAPQLDVSEGEEEYRVTVALPGVKPDDVEITIDRGTLTIRGELRRAEEIKDEQYLYRERAFGRFTRSIALPDQVQADAAEASFEDGLLRLRLPKAEELKPRRIRIAGAENRAIPVGEQTDETAQGGGSGQEQRQGTPTGGGR
jgi:HSP20 family protein